MTYPSSMQLLGTPFYPLTHNLDQVFEILAELTLYEEYAYIIDQAFALIENVGDEIAPDYPPEPLPDDLSSTDELARAHEAREAELIARDRLIADMEELLFSIHRSGDVRLLIEARRHPIHSAIRNQVDGTDQFSDDVLVYLYAIMKASQVVMTIAKLLYDAEEALFVSLGAEADNEAGRTLADTRENHPDVYATLLDDLRRKDFKNEVSTSIYASSLLSEAKSARLLASVYPSLDEAERVRESNRITQDEKREASRRGGKQLMPHYRWAFDYIKSVWPDIAYDDSRNLLSKRKLVHTLIDKLLPMELDRLNDLPNPEGVSRRIPGEKALAGNGSRKPGWLVELGYRELPKHFEDSPNSLGG